MSKKQPQGVKQQHIDEINALMPRARACELRPEFRIDANGAMVFRDRDHVLMTIAMLHAQLEKGYGGGESAESTN